LIKRGTRGPEHTLMSTERLRRIIYTSTATDALAATGAETVRVQAEDNNARDRITGFLAYSADSFLQIIEGPVSEMSALFARIEADQRHTDIEVLLDEPATQRFFTDWSMHYLDLDKKSVDPTPGALTISKFLLRCEMSHRRPVIDAYIRPFTDGSVLSIDDRAA
jgi:hypothetical protein